MDNKIKLEFIKRVLTDTVDDTQICENFFTKNEYPSEEEINNAISILEKAKREKQKLFQKQSFSKFDFYKYDYDK